MRLTDHDDASRDDDEFSAVFSYFDSSYSSEDDTPDDDKPLEEPKETVVKKTKPLTYEKRRTATTIYTSSSLTFTIRVHCDAKSRFSPNLESFQRLDHSITPIDIAVQHCCGSDNPDMGRHFQNGTQTPTIFQVSIWRDRMFIIFVLPTR